MKPFNIPLLCKISLLFLCCFALNFRSKAGHVDGAEITYKCTNIPGIFEITLIVYRECSGVPLCSGGCGSACTQTVSIKGADPIYSNLTFDNIPLNLESVKDIHQNAKCPSSKNACTNMGCTTAGTYTPAIERYVFKGFANIGSTSSIPANCCNIRFVWQQGARNSDIETGSATQSLYIDAIINRCFSLSPCNSSPEFTNEPDNVMCGGEYYIFNDGAVDPDHDSLSFEFTPALQDFGVPVTYTAPFAYNKPMPWTGSATGSFPSGISCNPFSGDIMFSPGNTSGQNFIGVIAIAVKQWKTINGVPTVIGIIRRDLRTTILAHCPPNNPPRILTNPALGANPNNPKYDWNFCTGVQTCFTITADDRDTIAPLIDSTYLSWNKALQNLGATFLPTYDPLNRNRTDSLGGPREDNYQFCWTPSESMASSIPYYFTVNAKDSRCPNPGKITRSFAIRVLAKPNLSIQQSTSTCGSYQLSYTNNSPTQTPQSVVWRIANEPEDWNLSRNPSVFSSQTTVNINRYKPGKYLVKLEANAISSGDGCSSIYYDTITIIQPQLKAIVKDTFSCGVHTIQLTAEAFGGDQPYNYRWFNTIADTNTGALNAPHYTSPTLNVTPGATRYYVIQISDINNCKSYDSVKVLVKPALSIQQSPLSCGNYQLSYINHTPMQAPHSVVWRIANEPEDWNLNQTPSVIESKKSFNIGRFKPGKYLVKLETDSANNGTNCAYIFYDTITVLSPQLKAIVKDTFSCAGNPIQLTASALHGNAPYTYRWFNSITDTDGIALNAPDYTDPHITVTPLATRYYIIQIDDVNNCKSYDSLKVMVTPVLKNSIIDPVSCSGLSDGKITLIMTDSVMTFQYRMKNGNFQSSNIFNNLSADTYEVEIKDSLNCSIVVPHLMVTSPPSIEAGTIVGPTTVVLNTTHAYSVTTQTALTYKWLAKNGIVTSPDSFTTLITWHTPGVDSVFVIANGANQQCADTSVLVVKIGLVGIMEMSEQMGIEVYPNPTQQNITVTIKKLPEQTSLQLYNMQGKLLIDQELKQSQQLNLETLPQGVYILKIGEWHGQVLKR